MKTNELMNGDLFMYRGCLCKFVIRPTGAIFQRIDGTEFLPCIVSEIKPIPLTEEILEVNGFYDCSEFYDGWNFDLTDNKRTAVSVGSIWFVHELQHALRLCGLHELADNFKVEGEE